MAKHQLTTEVKNELTKRNMHIEATIDYDEKKIRCNIQEQMCLTDKGKFTALFHADHNTFNHLSNTTGARLHGLGALTLGAKHAIECLRRAAIPKDRSDIRDKFDDMRIEIAYEFSGSPIRAADDHPRFPCSVHEFFWRYKSGLEPYPSYIEYESANKHYRWHQTFLGQHLFSCELDHVYDDHIWRDFLSLCRAEARREPDVAEQGVRVLRRILEHSSKGCNYTNMALQPRGRDIPWSREQTFRAVDRLCRYLVSTTNPKELLSKVVIDMINDFGSELFRYSPDNRQTLDRILESVRLESEIGQAADTRSRLKI